MRTLKFKTNFSSCGAPNPFLFWHVFCTHPSVSSFHIFLKISGYEKIFMSNLWTILQLTSLSVIPDTSATQGATASSELQRHSERVPVAKATKRLDVMEAGTGPLVMERKFIVSFVIPWTSSSCLLWHKSIEIRNIILALLWKEKYQTERDKLKLKKGQQFQLNLDIFGDLSISLRYLLI